MSTNWISNQAYLDTNCQMILPWRVAIIPSSLQTYSSFFRLPLLTFKPNILSSRASTTSFQSRFCVRFAGRAGFTLPVEGCPCHCWHDADVDARCDGIHHAVLSPSATPHQQAFSIFWRLSEASMFSARRCPACAAFIFVENVLGACCKSEFEFFLVV